MSRRQRPRVQVSPAASGGTPSTYGMPVYNTLREFADDNTLSFTQAAQVTTAAVADQLRASSSRFPDHGGNKSPPRRHLRKSASAAMPGQSPPTRREGPAFEARRSVQPGAHPAPRVLPVASRPAGHASTFVKPSRGKGPKLRGRDESTRLGRSSILSQSQRSLRGASSYVHGNNASICLPSASHASAASLASNIFSVERPTLVTVTDSPQRLERPTLDGSQSVTRQSRGAWGTPRSSQLRPLSGRSGRGSPQVPQSPITGAFQDSLMEGNSMLLPSLSGLRTEASALALEGELDDVRSRCRRACAGCAAVGGASACMIRCWLCRRSLSWRASRGPLPSLYVETRRTSGTSAV